MKTEKTLYYNTGRKEMEHLKKNIHIFRQIGVECTPFKYFPTKLLIRRFDFLYLNWYENVYQGSFVVAFTMYILKKFALLLARWKGVKIISSQHNKVQHDKKYSNLSQSLFKSIYTSSDKIIVFNPGAEEDLKMFLSPKEIKVKCFHVPPVNYIGSYPLILHEWIEKLRCPNILNVLFVGNMSHPYKNVEMVIDVAKEFESRKIRFLFVGNVADKAVKEGYLRKIGGATNIYADFRYVRDEEMADLLDVCDVVIAPYEIESISNSGTTRLAFSYGITVICPMIPSLSDIPQDLIYSYTYENKEDHRARLKDVLLRVYEDFKHDKASLIQKGAKLKQIMEDYHSPEVISKRYEQLFRSIA